MQGTSPSRSFSTVPLHVGMCASFALLTELKAAASFSSSSLSSNADAVAFCLRFLRTEKGDITRNQFGINETERERE